MKHKNITEGDDRAYPLVNSTESAGIWSSGGLTKREMFAAMAMQGILASWTKIVPEMAGVVENAVEYADALITELNKGEEKQ